MLEAARCLQEIRPAATPGAGFGPWVRKLTRLHRRGIKAVFVFLALTVLLSYRLIKS